LFPQKRDFSGACAFLMLSDLFILERGFSINSPQGKNVWRGENGKSRWKTHRCLEQSSVFYGSFSRLDAFSKCLKPSFLSFREKEKSLKDFNISAGDKVINHFRRQVF
jgi:hypothetical protein